jgi:Predicted nucleic-acid-binding protein, contains PIN domain
MPTRIVCFDTNILSWCLRTCRDNQQDKIEQAAQLINSLNKSKTKVAIPTIVLAETLSFIPEDSTQNFLELIKKHFLVFPFNSVAAYHYSVITRMKKNVEIDGARWSKSADVKIISTALAHGASCIYSEDEDMLKLADGILQVQCLPAMPPAQISLLTSCVRQ